MADKRHGAKKPMRDRHILILFHAGLFLIQIGAMVAAIMVDARFSTIGPAVSVIQAKLPAFPEIK